MKALSKYMKFLIPLASFCALLAGCAQMHPVSEPEDEGFRMKHAAQAYTDCVTREAERNLKNPLGAEDIAVAAHARCWSEWDRYRAATKATFFEEARTPEEMQLAGDKTDAHLRQFERDTRRSVVDHIVERTLSGPK